MPSLSGDTTPCKVTPVILHGIVSPGTLPCTSGCKPCLDALHSHPLCLATPFSLLCTPIFFLAHPSPLLRREDGCARKRMVVLSSSHTRRRWSRRPPPYTLNNLTSRSNENHYKLGHGSKSKAFVWFLVSPDSEEKCATAPPPKTTIQS